MALIGLFFGSDTGNTEAVAGMIQKELGSDLIDVLDVAQGTSADFEKYDLLILGIPTWYYGESQADWDDFSLNWKKVDFSTKLVAIFGCGDQEDYAEYFLDAMGTLRDIIVAKGATIVGYWPTEGYHFEASKALVDDKHFVGLGIDEDRQPEQTAERVAAWCQQLREEMCLSELV